VNKLGNRSKLYHVGLYRRGLNFKVRRKLALKVARKWREYDQGRKRSWSKAILRPFRI
jgi:hypothetical protein